MRRMKYAISMPIIIFTLGLLIIVSYAQERSINPQIPLLNSEFKYNRKLNDVDLGKRFYVTEYKRLPVYDFGLGKKSQAYNFGLGKRSGMIEDSEAFDEYDEYPYFEVEDDQIPELELYHDDDMQSLDKRQKAYNFGLGKRQHRYDFGLGKRGHGYNFGLGKRAETTMNYERFKNYLQGRGTRLGKRPKPNRFNFGLGKRSEEFDLSKNIIAKREVHESEENLSNKNADGGKDRSTNKTIEPESHEVMSHSDQSPVSKRSLHKYMPEEKSMGHKGNLKFSRQFRKPLYNFGLGKRTSSVYDLNKNKDKVSNK